MFGQNIQGSSSFSDMTSRMFRFEVAGLRQTYQSDKLSYPIRRSGTTVLAVPYSRMNEEMQRINRLGGKIVSIQPLVEGTSFNGAKSDATAAHQDAKVANREEDQATSTGE